MIYLLIVSLIWAFSFGLIKTNLTGLDPVFVSFLRLFISLLVFLPFLRLGGLSRKTICALVGTGAVQYGVMYLTYIYSYQYLQSYEIALFTVFTPIFVTFTNDLINKKVNKIFLLSAVIAVAGAGIILYKNLDSENFIAGFLLIQISNICFAAGQIFYSKIKSGISEISNHSIFGLLYLGAVMVTFITGIFSIDFDRTSLSNDQFWTLIYLGIVSSGIAFYLWNVGATKVNAGVLAIFNNLKIPLAMSVSIFIFGESGDIFNLAIGAIIILSALLINQRFLENRKLFG
ncbi:EamA family transporter [Bacteroidota bacterium]